MFSIVNVLARVLIIKSFFAFGKLLAFKNASIFLKTISPSLFPSSKEDFKSDFSNEETLLGIPNVAIIDAATKYTLSFSPSPFSFV